MKLKIQWTRTKIISLVGAVLIIGLGGWLLWKNGFVGADTIYIKNVKYDNPYNPSDKDKTQLFYLGQLFRFNKKVATLNSSSPVPTDEWNMEQMIKNYPYIPDWTWKPRDLTIDIINKEFKYFRDDTCGGNNKVFSLYTKMENKDEIDNFAQYIITNFPNQKVHFSTQHQEPYLNSTQTQEQYLEAYNFYRPNISANLNNQIVLCDSEAIKLGMNFRISTGYDMIRKADINKLNYYITLYQDAKLLLPSTDGWIGLHDKSNSNDSLAETLIPELKNFTYPVVVNLPCDPRMKGQCETGRESGYMYYREDYCDGDKNSYNIYAKMDKPTFEYQGSSMPNIENKCDAIAIKYGMNYKVSLPFVFYSSPPPPPSLSKIVDTRRKDDLTKLKTAIDKHNTQNKKLPTSDGWIAAKDIANANDSLAETLLPAKVIDTIPCDPANTAENCASGITYQYWRGDYSGFGGTDQEYALYAKLDNPSDKDLATMDTGNAKMNAKAKEYGMNYRVGN